MRVLVTGANGFVGQHTCAALTHAGHIVTAATRSDVGDISGDTDWRPWLKSQEAVVHLAAHVHQMQDKAPGEYSKVNTQATLNLAKQAAEAEVQRFIFLSTAKVMGEGRDTPYTMQDKPAPEDAYARSKWEAEQSLAQSPMQVVILRPPLVYGPDVRANFLRMMEAVTHGIPLPFGAVQNRRSLIYVGNLAQAIVYSLQAIPPGTYLLSDGEDVSTPELIRKVALALNRPARLLSVPPGILQLAGKILGKEKAVNRLLGSFAIESHLPGWQPPFTPAQGLRETAEWFTKQHAQ